MGHCAPTVLETLLQLYLEERRSDDLILLAAGLPGGIGNSGAECGGITGAIMTLGLHFGRERIDQVVAQGREYIDRFEARNGIIFCREIGTGLRPCLGAICGSPELYGSLCLDCEEAVGAQSGRVIADFHRISFHCAGAVLQAAEGELEIDDDILDAACGFIGGTALRGHTCSALTGGVMIVGLAIGEIESSVTRVLKMGRLMAEGGDAMADDVNKFNRAIKTGQELARWFVATHGSSECTELCGCDFSSGAGVEGYFNQKRYVRCRRIADSVAEKALTLI